MKKIYLLLFALFFTLVQYGQNLAAIDRVNGPTPTTTGTVANVSAIGLTRMNVTQVGLNTVASFTSSNWETAATRNTTKYLQWSVQGNIGYSLILDGLDIRYQRVNNQAPKIIDIYYSTDGFITSTLLSSATYANNDGLVKTLSISMTGIVVGSGATLTFRLYGYDSANVNGQLNINGNTAWAVGSVTNPGIRIRGTVSNADLLFNNGVWMPFAPNASTGNNFATIVAGTYTPASNIALNTLTIASLGNMVLPTGVTANILRTSLESSSQRYSSLIVSGILNSIVNYRRHVNINNGTGTTTGNNDLISAPLSGQTFGAFAFANANIVSDPNNSARKLFGPFDKSTGTYVIYNSTTDAGVPLVAGLGYRAASTDNGGFIFTGTVNTGTVSQAISNTGPMFKEWNLIGNPYPSYLNLAAFLAVNNSQFDTNASGVYGYDGMASDGYVIWNQAYADANPSAAMTPGQGFLVASKVGGGSIDFTPAMRTIGTTDDFIAGRSTGNISFLKLNATNGNLNYFTDFYFSDNASLNLDPGYDAAVFGYNAPEFAIYSHLVQGNTGKDMAIQSIGNSDLANEVIIPLGINAAQGQQVTISIAESTISPDMNVYLEDTVNGSFTLLNTADYSFTANTTLNDTGRFFLRFSQSTLSLPEKNGSSLQIYATSTPRTLFVKGELTAATTITLYDTLGRQVLASNLNAGSTSNNVDVSSLSTGVYVVKLNNALQQKTQKVILK